jgi:hypothetical protein
MAASDSSASSVSSVSSAPAASGDESKPLRRCKCGTSRLDPHAAPQREYSMLGAMYLLWGGTCVPSRVNFCCVLCGETFDAVTDRSDCYQYVI